MHQAFRNNIVFILHVQGTFATTLKAGASLKGNGREMVILKNIAKRKAESTRQSQDHTGPLTIKNDTEWKDNNTRIFYFYYLFFWMANDLVWFGDDFCFPIGLYLQLIPFPSSAFQICSCFECVSKWQQGKKDIYFEGLRALPNFFVFIKKFFFFNLKNNFSNRLLIWLNVTFSSNHEHITFMVLIRIFFFYIILTR